MELEVVDDYDPDAWLLTIEEFETLSPREQRRYLKLLARAAEEWVLLPRQQDADRLADKVDCLLFGGSAGPGKSTWLLHRAARLSIKHPKHTTLMLRRTFPELKRSLIRKSILWYAGLPSEHRPTWRAGEKEWWFPNGSIIEFGHCVGAATPILMADGTYKPMVDVQAGDMVGTLEGPRRVLRHWRVGVKPAVVVSLTPDLHVVVSQSHAVLSAAGLWSPPVDPCGTPTRSLLAGIDRTPTGGFVPSPGPPPPASRPGLSPARLGERADRREAQPLVIDAWSAGARTGGGGPLCSIRDERLPLPWYAHLGLHGPAAQSAGLAPGIDLLDAAPHVLSASQVPGSRAGCRPDHGSGDAPVPRASADGPLRTPSPGDAGTRSRSTVPQDDRARTRARSPWGGAWYSHPYTMEARPLAVDVLPCRARMALVGDRDLWDMTVEGANHYVSQGGMVHRNCETDDDTQIYLSAEYDMIVFDEQTQFTEDQYTMVRSRARTTRDKMRDGVHPHVIGATNPGQVGHSWNKRDFVDATNYGMKVHQRELADPKDPERVATLSFAYVHSTVRDNPHMDEGYVRNLLSLPDVKRAQYLDGDWDVFAGMFFADDFDRSIHVVDSMPEEWGGLPPEAWPQVYAIDFGTAAPWCALWGVWDNDGCLWVWHEEYGPGLIPSEQATAVKRVEARRKSQFGVGDPSMWKQSHRSAGVGQTIADQYSEHGVYLLPAKNERVAGWGRVRDYLRRDSYGVPGIRIIGPACPNLVRTLPEQVTDSVNPEDIDTDGEDHAVDALRYLCMTRDRKYRPAAPVSTSLVDEIDARRDKKRRKRKQPSW